jgi:hypothetical protein
MTTVAQSSSPTASALESILGSDAVISFCIGDVMSTKRELLLFGFTEEQSACSLRAALRVYKACKAGRWPFTMDALAEAGILQEGCTGLGSIE